MVLSWSRGQRIAYTAFFAVWSGSLLAIFVSQLGTDTALWWRLFPLAMVVAGTVGYVRVVRMEVRTLAEEMVVRNPLRSHRIARADLTGFHTGPNPWGWRRGLRVYAGRRDGRAVALVALDPLPFEHRAIEPDLDRLEAWRSRGS